MEGFHDFVIRRGGLQVFPQLRDDVEAAFGEANGVCAGSIGADNPPDGRPRRAGRVRSELQPVGGEVLIQFTQHNPRLYAHGTGIGIHL